MSDLVQRYVDLTGTVALDSGPWITFNTILATVPAVLAVALFHRTQRRTLGWWFGAIVFVLFLPNAPYVVTDVLHLRGMVTGYPGTRASALVPAGALAALVLWGVAMYSACLVEVDRIVARLGWSRWRVAVRAALHLLCGFGVVLGRIPRLHSWHVVTRPYTAADGILSVLHPLMVPLVIALAISFALSAAAFTAVARAAYARVIELAQSARRLASARRPSAA